jgi:predicted small lipoprotein YifL
MVQFLIIFTLLLTSCGQMGDLYLPKEEKSTAATEKTSAPKNTSAEATAAQNEQQVRNQPYHNDPNLSETTPDSLSNANGPF